MRGKSLSIKLSCLITIIALASSNTSMAIAKPQDEKNKKVTIEEALNDSQLNKFSSNPEVQKQIEILKDTNAKSFKKESYVRLTKDSDGTITSQVVSEENFPKIFFNDSKYSSLAAINQSNSWIKLTLEAYNTGGKNYFLVGGYTWIKDPLYTFNDTFAIGHDATATFDTANSFSYHQSPWHGPTTGGGPMAYNDKEQNYKGTDSTHCKRDISGVAYKYDLETSYCNHPYSSDPEYGVKHYPFGMVYVNSTFNDISTGANIQVSYMHQQLSLDYNINDAIKFLTSGAIEPKIKGSSDIFTVGDRIR